MFDSLIARFFQLNYPEKDYKFTDHSGEFYKVVILLSGGVEVGYAFTLIDEEKMIFSVNSEQGFFVFQSINNTLLQDITRNVISAEEVLIGFEHDFEDSSELNKFLSNSENINLTYEKLDLSKKWFGNTWLVSLNPMYDDFDFTKDDIFASMNYSTMYWDPSVSKFKHAVTPNIVRESRYSGSAIDINGDVLFLAVTAKGHFSVDEYIPSEGADSTLVYEGEFKSFELAKPEYCKIVITNLKKLPHANFKIYLGDQKISGTTPVAFLGQPDNSFQHFNLKQLNRQKALKEFESKIREVVPTNLLDVYLEELNDLE